MMMIFMKVLAAILCMFFTVSTGNDTISTRVVGGEDTDISEHPYMVQVFSKGRFQCGGVIIGTNWMLTAGHCVNKINQRELRILAGSSCRNEGTSHFVDKVIIHTEFNTIALIQVAPIFTFSEYVQPIKMVSHTDILQDYTEVTILGWGETMEYGKLTDQLQKVILHTISNRKCQELLPHWKIIPGMFCAMSPDYGKGVCDADAGGPAFSKDGKLMGIVSSAEGCARTDVPSVYVRISFYRKWIEVEAGI